MKSHEEEVSHCRLSDGMSYFHKMPCYKNAISIFTVLLIKSTAGTGKWGSYDSPLTVARKWNYNLLKRNICLLKMPDIVYFPYVPNNDLIEFYSFLLSHPLLLVISFHPFDISFENAHHRPNILFSL